MVAWDKVCAKANASLSEVSVIRSAADSLKVQPVVVFGLAALFIASFALYGFCGSLICTLVGSAYPSYESFKALESGEHQVIQFWLTYWVAYAVAMLVESVWYYLLIWFPFYYPLKLGFLLWLYLPSTRGAEHVYNWVIRPVLVKNRDTIDNAIQKSSKEMKRSLSGIPQTITTGAITAGAGALTAGIHGVVRFRKSLSKSFEDNEGSDVVRAQPPTIPEPTICENEDGTSQKKPSVIPEQPIDENEGDTSQKLPSVIPEQPIDESADGDTVQKQPSMIPEEPINEVESAESSSNH